MPYKIAKVVGGYQVIDPMTKHKFSKNPLTKSKAQKQRVAIALSESKMTHEPVSHYFA